MSHTAYLIDSNSLITPSRTFYQFKFAPAFWERLEHEIASGRIVILDLVKWEIDRGNDDLSKWLDGIQIGRYIDRRNEDIVSIYRDVLDHVSTNPCYKPSALKEWSEAATADPWLIASAKVFGVTIVTFERINVGLNKKQPSSKAKIPDVASFFDVRVCNLFKMMDDLGFTL